MYYSGLKETRRIPDISDQSGGKQAAMPATIRIHAVHVADNETACGYTRKPEDVPDSDRDWFAVGPGEVPCEDCRKATQGNQ
jgi:hypothetical protein